MNVKLHDQIYTLPDLHVMVAGVPNGGKSEFAASAEKPMLVLAADPLSKMETYFKRGIRDPKVYTGEQGQPVWLVRSPKTGNVIIQVEGYYDEDERNPQAMNQLLARLPQVTEEVRAGRIRTVVVDSWTQLEWIARARRTTGAFAGVDSIYGAAKDDLQAIINARLMNLRCNLIVIFHIETKVTKDRKGNITKDSKQDIGGGEMSYSIQAIGTLKNVGNVFGECYLAVAPVDGSDNYYLVTRRNADFRTLCSRIGAPDPCKNEWTALFGPWLEAEAAKRAAASAATTGAVQASPHEGESQ